MEKHSIALVDHLETWWKSVLVEEIIKANFSEKKEDEKQLFYNYQAAPKAKTEARFINSLCNNHMTGDDTIFMVLDTSVKSQVKLAMAYRSRQKEKVLPLCRQTKARSSLVMFYLFLASNKIY